MRLYSIDKKIKGANLCLRQIEKNVEAYLIENQQAHYRYVYGMIKNPTDAMDILQDSIVKALKKVPTA